MTVGVLSLVEFLLARITEDEAVARRTVRDHVWNVIGNRGWDDFKTHIARHDPARVLAECEAKRRIVGSWIAGWSEPEDGYPSRPLGGEGGELYYDVLCHLAAVYADHPDYRDEWKP